MPEVAPKRLPPALPVEDWPDEFEAPKEKSGALEVAGTRAAAAAAMRVAAASGTESILKCASLAVR